MPRQANAAEGIESFQLPKALVTRIAKSNLPGETKFQKDTVNALVDSATVFINFLASTAHEVTSSKSRKIITAPDILQALELVDLSDLVPLLEQELELYRNSGKGERSKTSTAGNKGKGKEKESVSETLQPDEATPLTSHLHPELEEEEEGDEEDGQVEEEPDRKDNEEIDDVMEEENEEQDDEQEGEEDEEPDEIVDTVAMEEEELQKDNQGLEEE